MQSEEANNPGKRVVFIAIGLALLGLVIFGVVWAKNRADEVAANSETSQQTETNTETETVPTEEEPVATQEGEVAGTEISSSQDSEEATTTESATTIPAAGANEVLLNAAIVIIAAFAIAKFVQSEILARRV
ncbi:MAG TPA: hypothetical protein VLA77_05030 [Candidatus Saccharimonadales bacterium]|nr:hypothetical protein [Candidatus Saccharimonadales bacterium]